MPAATIDTLHAACDAREVTFVRVDAARYAWSTHRPLPPGSLLYRPAVSTRAMAVEQALLGPGVATFHRTPLAPFQDVHQSWLLHQRAGLPVPPTVPFAPAPGEDGEVEALAAMVGGLPAVLKVPGHSGGVGVVRVDTVAALHSWARNPVVGHGSATLMRYIPDATHWRVVVVGERAVASYPNPLDEDDFRSYASTDPAAYRAGAEADMERVAVASLHVLGHEFGGVDLLRGPDGALWLLEANFPCYHAQAQVVGGIDVAGAMVEHLLACRRTASAPGTALTERPR